MAGEGVLDSSRQHRKWVQETGWAGVGASGKREGSEESLGEGRGQTRGGAAPLLSLLILGVGTPPPAGGASGYGWKEAAQNFQGQALPLGRAQGPPEVDKAGGPTPSRTDCHARRLAEELLSLFRAWPSSSPRGGGSEGGRSPQQQFGGWRGGWGHQCPLPPQG